MRCLAIAAAAILVLAMSAPLRAVTLIEDPFETHSWGQRFVESGVGSFDHIQAKILYGPNWEPPASRNFSVSGWVNTNDDTVLVAEGPATTDMQFDFIWLDNPPPLCFIFQAWNGTALREEATATYAGGGWSFASSTSGWERQDSPVPEPATLAGLVLGLGCIVRYLRTRRQRLARSRRSTLRR